VRVVNDEVVFGSFERSGPRVRCRCPRFNLQPSSHKDYKILDIL
jgi:hypothetical protein